MIKRELREPVAKFDIIPSYVCTSCLVAVEFAQLCAVEFVCATLRVYS